jgi:NRPS condensation-like uncharacterized protein
MEYRAEIFDRMQWLFEETCYNDHQLHCVLWLGSPLDAVVLESAVSLSLKAIPILATRYRSEERRAVWESLPGSDLGRAFVSTKDESVFESERTYRIREELGPQIRLCLLYGSRNALAVTMNHMIADAAGFKDYLYFLCDIYTCLRRDPGYKPATTIDGARGMGMITRAVGPLAKVGALLGLGGGSNRDSAFAFPWGEGGAELPFIATREIGREKVARLKEYCRRRGATLNDAAIAAYYRVLARRLGPSALAGLEIPIMVDMRRLLPSREFLALTNLSSTAITHLEQRAGEDFDETLGKAKAQMDGFKKGRIGLGGFVKLSLLFSLFGENSAPKLLRRGLKNPLICMTNIGELDSSRLRLEGAVVESAYMCGSIKHKPHFQLALSGFDGTLTLSSNLYGNREDRKTVQAFLEEVEEELTV